MKALLVLIQNPVFNSCEIEYSKSYSKISRALLDWMTGMSMVDRSVYLYLLTPHAAPCKSFCPDLFIHLPCYSKLFVMPLLKTGLILARILCSTGGRSITRSRHRIALAGNPMHIESLQYHVFIVLHIWFSACPRFMIIQII